MHKGMVQMTTDKQQRTGYWKAHWKAYWKTHWKTGSASSLGIALLALTSSLSLAQDNSAEAEEPAAPWYQVEVVIFTQEGFTGAEQPPRRYNLDFPKNNLDLLDPSQVSDNNFPISGNGVVSTTAARIIPLAIAEDPALTLSAQTLAALSDSELESAEEQILEQISGQQDLEQDSPFDDYDLAQLNAQDAAFLASNLNDDLGANQTAAQTYIAEYEPTFVKLPRDVRNLNESARALDRQTRYNVLFHEAWRFSADEQEQDPWVIIKAGKQYLDRFEIEGSLRFYKSRFLHFQSDLWLLEFDPQSDTANMIELPDFPMREQASLADSHVIAETQFDEQRIEDFFIDAPEKDFDDTVTAVNSDQESPAFEEVQPPRQYPVKTLWTFDQSKRLEEQQSYYIDHPKVGILVTIIPYEPEILNPLLEETLAEAE